jgi:hypothetical protein
MTPYLALNRAARPAAAPIIIISVRRERPS